MLSITAISFAVVPANPIIPFPSTLVCTTTVTAPVSVPAAPALFNGFANPGNSLYVPQGVPAELAAAPQTHLLPICPAIPSSPTPIQPSEPEPHPFDGVLNVVEPLFVPPESALNFVDLSKPTCATGSHSTDGFRNVQPKLWVPPEARNHRFLYEMENYVTPPTTPTHNATENTEILPNTAKLNIPPPDYQEFWQQYWAKEEKRQERLAKSIFPNPLPKPAEMESKAGMALTASKKLKIDDNYIRDLMRDIAQFSTHRHRQIFQL